MNAVTKVLIVLIFILSIVFAASQVILFGKREDFGAKYAQAAAQLTNTRAAEEKVKAELADLKNAYDRAKLDFEARAAGLEKELADAKSNASNLSGQVKVLTTTVQQHADLINSLQAEVATRDKSIDDLKATLVQRDQTIKEHLDKIAELNATVATRVASIGELKHALTETKKALKTTSDNEADLLAIMAELRQRGIAVPPMPLPAINGRVVRVDPKNGIAVVNKGERAGVKPNTQFTVYSGTDYVARLIIHDVQPDNSVGLIQLLADGKKVRQGDRATTEIP